MSTQPLLPFIVLFPLIAAYLILLVGPRYWRMARITSLIASLLTWLLSLAIGYEVWVSGPMVYHFGNWSPPWGIEFLVDHVSALFAVTVTTIGFLIIVFGFQLAHKDMKRQVMSQYYGIFLILVAALLGIAYSNDLFNIYILLEISSVAAAALVAVNGHKFALEASIKYLILSTLGSATVLLAIANIYSVTGHLNLGFIGDSFAVAYQNYPLNILVSLGFLMVGLTIKAALYPLHIWLPDAHGSAPTASSAILSALVVKVYIMVLIKILFRVLPFEFIGLVPLDVILLIMSTLAIIMGSIYAIRQTDLKRMLAYSTVAQIGYIFLGIGLFTFHGLLGALLHIVNHAVMKGMLFLAAGLLITLTGQRSISSLRGLGRVYPIPMVAFSLGALSMVGIPPLSGFFSKWYLGLGALEANQPIFLIVILASSLLNALYYLPIVINAFFSSEPEIIEVKPIPSGAKISLIALSALTVVLGLFSTLPVQYLTPVLKVWFQ